MSARPLRVFKFEDAKGVPVAEQVAKRSRIPRSDKFLMSFTQILTGLYIDLDTGSEGSEEDGSEYED